MTAALKAFSSKNFILVTQDHMNRSFADDLTYPHIPNFEPDTRSLLF